MKPRSSRETLRGSKLWEEIWLASGLGIERRRGASSENVSGLYARRIEWPGVAIRSL